MFRFTIRELVLLTLVVAMGVGWWLDHSALSRRADLWEYRAGAVADWTSGEGWRVEWTPEGVDLTKPGGEAETDQPEFAAVESD